MIESAHTRHAGNWVKDRHGHTKTHHVTIAITNKHGETQTPTETLPFETRAISLKRTDDVAKIQQKSSDNRS